ncbi:MAG: BglG family transcription antiterminator [Eubacterium sp.]
MNRFDDRKKKIISIIANSDGYVTGKCLSLTLNTSLRTIQSEISSINRELPLIYSSNKGYKINKENFFLLSKDVITPDRNSEHVILKKLIFADKPYQIDELAESLYMSTTTLEKHLKKFVSILEKYDLVITRKKSYIHIEGNELNKRKLINYLIIEEINPAFNSINNLKNYFPDTDIEKIKSIILNSINKYDYFVESTYYNNLIINIVIALYRMKTDYYVSNVTGHDVNLECDEYRIAYEICAQYAAHCHITPSNYDISYISTLLEGQIKPLNCEVAEIRAPEVLSPEFISDIDNILMNVFNYYMLNINYSEYLYSFALHIQGMIKRTHNTQPANNEILNNIKKSCPFIYDVSVSIAQKISEKYLIHVADSEIGYISIHIGFLIESSTENTDKISIVLFCNDYHHINENIEKKLMDNFSDFIHINIFRADSENSIINVTSDLIITTEPLNIIGKKVLTISPFYTMMDHINIDNAIHECLREKKKRYHNKLLSSFFDENLFFKNDCFHSKNEVINFLGQKIIDFGLAKKGFIDSVLERERLSSTCFFDTFAIPHAIDMNARRTMICVLTSEKGIYWDEHKIHIVLMITVQQQDRKKFMELYNGIVHILENPEKVNKLVLANTLMDFLNQLMNS